jgi:Asp/Glu/hydantoin racemase
MKILCMLPTPENGGLYPPEAERRRIELIESYATTSTQIDIGYMGEASGFTPWGQAPDDPGYELVARAHEVGAKRALQAELEGYDAFCPFGTLDLGVRVAREKGVRIPVIGQLEAAALYCGMLGRPFASCTYVDWPEVIRDLEVRVGDLGLSHLYVSRTWIGIENTEYAERRDEVLERFVAATEKARSEGAEMMGLIAMSICPTEFSAKQLSEASGGFPVVDALGAQMGLAEWWHRNSVPGSLMRVPR